MLTPDLVEALPTKALSDFVTALEAFNGLLGNVDDCEGVIVQLEGGVHSAIHIIDAELQCRPAAAR